MKPEHSVQQILNNHAELFSSVTQKLKWLARLNKLWHAQLDATLANHCRVANLREQCLIIEVESAAWLMQLRFQIPALLKTLRKNAELRDLKEIKWYIQPAVATARSTKRRPQNLSLSTHTAQLLRETAESMSNAKLRKALENLAKRGKEK